MGPSIPPRVRIFLIVVITMVWAANFTAPIFIKGYTPPEAVQIAFMAAVGYLLATYKKNGADEKGGG